MAGAALQRCIGCAEYAIQPLLPKLAAIGGRWSTSDS
jgi:hypothetical protein